ncbi:MAG: hypothetical protein NZ480_01380, partial [Bdellovibrionaceae bacterium]|nr:hypothetical protein [Pseudobdellovibrionaceae bacterium]
MHFITHDHFSGKLEVTPEEVKVSMPSNIALIKYMGRMDNQLNIPLNPSLSLTLSNLRSLIIARPCHQEGNSDELEPLSEGEFFVRLDPDGKNRFLQFWA